VRYVSKNIFAPFSLFLTVEGDNFEHLANFEAQLKICWIFAVAIFGGLKPIPKILLGVASPFNMV
jgi:hypothetical protein